MCASFLVPNISFASNIPKHWSETEEDSIENFVEIQAIAYFKTLFGPQIAFECYSYENFDRNNLGKFLAFQMPKEGNNPADQQRHADETLAAVQVKFPYTMIVYPSESVSDFWLQNIRYIDFLQVLQQERLNQPSANQT